MAAAELQQLDPEEELRYLREVLNISQPDELMDRVVHAFTVLQTRSAMLLSLITLCLTVSGFSGHRIAATGPVPAGLLSLGLFLTVVSAGLLLKGPLRLRWVTRHACPDGLDTTLLALIQLRDRRTRDFHFAAACLVVGLSSYMLAVVLFLLSGGQV